MRLSRYFKILFFCFLVFLLFHGYALAENMQVYFAGFAFSGSNKNVPEMYPESYLVSNSVNLSKILIGKIKKIKNPNFNINVNSLSDNSIHYNTSTALALVEDGETQSLEQYQTIYKFVINIHAEALFYNFSKKMIIGSFPISITYINSYNFPPTEQEKINDVEKSLYSNPNVNLFSKFADMLKNIQLPKSVYKYAQVTKVIISDQAKETILKHPDIGWQNSLVAQQAIANAFNSALLSEAGIPMEPFFIGSAIGGKLTLVFANSNIYENLTPPQPDYSIILDLKGFKHVRYKSNQIGYSEIYGAFISIEVVDPLINKIYLKATFKNGVIKIIPITQTTVATGPAYKNAVDGLFLKFANALKNGGNDSWTKNSTNEKDIRKILSETYNALREI